MANGLHLYDGTVIYKLSVLTEAMGLTSVSAATNWLAISPGMIWVELLAFFNYFLDAVRLYKDNLNNY